VSMRRTSGVVVPGRVDARRAYGRRRMPVVAAAVAAFTLAWVAIGILYAPEEQRVDTPLYRSYGDAIAEGQLPYGDFQPEYPPAALPVFGLPSVVLGVPSNEKWYARIFLISMAACGGAAIVLMGASLRALDATIVRTAAALGAAAVVPLALGPVVLSRFDYWPSLIAAAAVAALLRGHDRLSSGLLGVGVAAKLYPVVLVPLAAVWILRPEGRRHAIACGAVIIAVVTACFLPFLVLAADGLIASIRFQLSRPLEIESLGAAVLVALHHLVGLNLTTDEFHGSWVAGRLGERVGVAHSILQAGAVLGVWCAWIRGPMERERLVRYAAAAVLAFVVFGKVLSPQFLIWLAPVVPLVRGRRGFVASALVGVSLVLTQLWFPSRWSGYAHGFDELTSWLVLARDATLLAALAIVVWPAREKQETLADDVAARSSNTISTWLNASFRLAARAAALEPRRRARRAAV
jgi:hypothetical protein